MSRLQNYRKPVNMIAAVNIIAFGLLYLYKRPFDYYILLAGLSIILLVYAVNFILVKANLGDEYLFSIAAMLCSIGVIMLYRLDPVYGFKQIIWFAGGNLLFFLSYIIYRKVKRWDELVYVYPLASFGLFIVTLFFGVNVKGATNWVRVGNYGFQPSEIIKLLFVFFLAAYFKYPEKLNFKMGMLKEKYLFAAVVYLYLVFLALQRELGFALLFFMIYLTILYVFEDSRKFILLNIAIAFTGGLIGVALFRHVQVRIEAWLNPWADIAGKGYQITQSLFAIGEGGFFGRGLGLGSPEFIPEVHTDFIFSAICEEMGIFGGIAVILLYFILTYRGLKITLKIRDIFSKCLALGLTVMFGYQTFLIIGGVIKLIPLTGITLPFISYGGSSLTTSFAALGVLQALSKESSEDGEVTVNHEG